MLIIGLTGGIGSGKSTIAEIFIELGVPCCDADEFARSLTQADSPALQEIRETFGSEIITNDGQLDRQQLRKLIFSDPDERKKLETILHPRIRQKIQQWVKEQTSSYCVVSVPLLAENYNHYPFDRIIVVQLAQASQRKRTAIRDKVDESAIQAIITNQASEQQRLAIADDLIDNNGDIHALRQQITGLHEQYLKLTN
ncbi:MAG: dephospho-CoA kinase [Thiotrichales bacterium]|nr:dephospho-CoA kinase [Thiotrichales bacterium]